MFRDTGPVREVPGIRGAPGWALHSPSPASRAPGEGGAGRVESGKALAAPAADPLPCEVPRRRWRRGHPSRRARSAAGARRGGSTFPRPGRGVSGHPLPAQVGVRAALGRGARGGGGACSAQEAELHSGPGGGVGVRGGRAPASESARPGCPRASARLPGDLDGEREGGEERSGGEDAPRPGGPGGTCGATPRRVGPRELLLGDGYSRSRSVGLGSLQLQTSLESSLRGEKGQTRAL